MSWVSGLRFGFVFGFGVEDFSWVSGLRFEVKDLSWVSGLSLHREGELGAARRLDHPEVPQGPAHRFKEIGISLRKNQRAPHLAHLEGCAALRIVLVTMPHVSRSCEHSPDGFKLHPLHRHRQGWIEVGTGRRSGGGAPFSLPRDTPRPCPSERL